MRIHQGNLQRYAKWAAELDRRCWHEGREVLIDLPELRADADINLLGHTPPAIIPALCRHGLITPDHVRPRRKYAISRARRMIAMGWLGINPVVLPQTWPRLESGVHLAAQNRAIQVLIHGEQGNQQSVEAAGRLLAGMANGLAKHHPWHRTPPIIRTETPILGMILQLACVGLTRQTPPLGQRYPYGRTVREVTAYRDREWKVDEWKALAITSDHPPIVSSMHISRMPITAALEHNSIRNGQAIDLLSAWWQWRRWQELDLQQPGHHNLNREASAVMALGCQMWTEEP